MAVLTDDQLMLVEQLTYMNGTSKMAEGSTVAQLVELYDKYGVTESEAIWSGNASTYKENTFITDAEKHAVLEQIRENPEIMGLTLARKDTDINAYCFLGEGGEPVVAFKGTFCGAEWVDNGESLGLQDTPCQTKALDFVNSLPYDDISVVGHSKGGNKAQYITLVSEKNVVNCVSMDGEGFSPDFIAAYSNQICERGGVIKNYSLATDYVHMLMLPVPGAEQIYITGVDPNRAGAKNHSPVSYYEFYTDSFGIKHMRLNADGAPALVRAGSENEGITYLREFTEYLANNVTRGQRYEIGHYLGIILGLSMYNDEVITDVDGKAYTFRGARGGAVPPPYSLLDFLKSHPVEIGTILACIAQYAVINNLSDEQIDALIDAFMPPWLQIVVFDVIPAILDELANLFPNIASFFRAGKFTLSTIVKLLASNLKDGKHDPVIEYILGLLGKLTDFDAAAFYKAIERQLGHLTVVNAGAYTANPIMPQELDYTENARQALTEVISYIGSMASSVSQWQSYGSEDWYEKLFIDNMIQGISAYVDNIQSLCADCQEMANNCFEKAWNADIHGGGALSELYSAIEQAVAAAEAFKA